MKTKFTLRISEEMLKKIEYLADYDGRSINREIETAIKRFIRDFERLNGEIKTKRVTSETNCAEKVTKTAEEASKI